MPSMESIAEDPDQSRSPEKVQKRYGNLRGDVVIVELQKGPNGLGLSLAGHKDRNKMSTFIVGVNPAGIAHKDGRIQVGDEILEVNDQVLHGRCHLNACAIIKSLSVNTFKIVLLRSADSIKDLAVKPITQFPVQLGQETAEDRYATYQGVRHVVLKKTSVVGLGIMIMEGKHAEAGQGIFISDIQKDSVAAQAGLMVGDMILAVNGEELIGADYDTAASVLKKAEGNIRVVVANLGSMQTDNQTGGGLESVVTDANEKGSTRPSLAVLNHSVVSIKEPAKFPPAETIVVEKESKIPKSIPSFISSLSVSIRIPSKTPSPVSSVSVPMLTSVSSPTIVSHTLPEIQKQSYTLPKPSKSKHTDEHLDPAVCNLRLGTETVIEITKGKSGLGLSVVGGVDTSLGAIVVHEVYPEGAAAKDGRLQPGDQILEVNSEKLCSVTLDQAISILQQAPAKVRMIVNRLDSQMRLQDIYECLDVELQKKPGKGIGLSIVGKKNNTGVYISDVIKGGMAEADGRLMQGDQILSVNNQDLKNSTQEQVATILKTAMGRVHIKVGRIKIMLQHSKSDGSINPRQNGN